MRLTGLTLPILLGALLIQVVTVGAKPGMCPYSPAPCIENPKIVCKAEKYCNGTEKCCWDGCQYRCTEPELIKTGVCPLSPKPGTACPSMIPLKNHHCTGDQNCNGTQKCCLYDCQYQCKEPEVMKPGVCPKSRTPCSGMLNMYCQSDKNCNGTKKCCQDGCNVVCKEPAVLIKRVCPKTRQPCPSKNSQGCSRYSSCGTKKCCWDGCWYTCIEPEVIKAGDCPKSPTPDTACPPVIPMEDRHCTEDLKCNGTQKCCLYNCQYQCKNPTMMTQGKCPEGPKPLTTCEPRRIRTFCQSDLQCDGQKCCMYDCQNSCSELLDSDGEVLTQL